LLTGKPRTKQKPAEVEDKRPKRSKQIKQESEEPPTRSTRSKQKPKKKVEADDSDEAEIPRPIQIKQEKLSLEKAKEIEEPVKRSTRTKTKEAAKTGPTSPARSEKSVYEDAVANDAVVLVKKLSAADIASLGTPPPKGDETYVQQPGSANATYNLPSAQNSGTPGVSDATFDVNTAGSPAVMDGTYVLPTSAGQTPTDSGATPKQTPNSNESLMTEDNSQGEDSENECLAKMVPKKAQKAAAAPTLDPKSTKGKKNELFNPNIHSPIKRKIEAFEKAAASSVYASPAQLRPKTSRIPSKYNTPNLNLKPKPSTSSTVNTPTGQSLNTLMSNAQGIKAISSSTSKLAHIQKKQNAATSTKSHSLSREPSAEDLRRANASALEEKKKKREEKLRLVHQQKEQIEKEKREQAEKQMREREEKYRKMIEEKELEQAKKKAERKRLDEIKQANVKMAEQAKLEQERAEELKRLEELKR
jgi:inner centromere protein